MTAKIQKNRQVTKRTYPAYLVSCNRVYYVSYFIVTWSYSKLNETCLQPNIQFLLLHIHTDNITSHFIKPSLASKFYYRISVEVFVFTEFMLHVSPIWHSVSCWKCYACVPTLRACCSRNWKRKHFVSFVAENTLLLFEQGICCIQTS